MSATGTTMKDEHKDTEHGNTTSSNASERDREDASSTKHGEGWGRGGIVGFFEWLFGLPASTTVGEIRANLEATTSASSSSSSEGLGFWARIMSFFHIGGDK